MSFTRSWTITTLQISLAPTTLMITSESIFLLALSTSMVKQRWHMYARAMEICSKMSGAQPDNKNSCWLSNRS